MRTGRPPKAPEERLIDVHSRVLPDVWDAIDRRAVRERKTNAALIREILTQTFRVEKVLNRGNGRTLSSLT